MLREPIARALSKYNMDISRPGSTCVASGSGAPPTFTEEIACVVGRWRECLADHAVFASNWPKIFDAYAGPNRIPGPLIEAAMIAVNSVNSCRF